VTLRNLGPGTDIVFSLPDTQVIASGSQLIINPSSDLIADNPYAVRISTNAVSDLAGNPYAGIADDTSWNFRLGVPNPVYLIHHWKFDADMNDSAGTHDVTPTGDAARTTGSGGKFGEALVLDGDGDYVTTTVGLSSLPSSDFSLTAWIFRENATNYSSIAGSQNGGSEGAFLRAEPASGGATGTNTLFANLLPPGDSKRAWGGVVPLNQWAHVAMTVSSTAGLTLYINGVSVASDPAATGHTTWPVFRIGAPAYLDAWFFDGLIDDVAIFDHVLDAGQIGNVMTYGADNWTLGTILLSGNTVASNSPPGTLVGSLSFNDDIADEFGLSVTDSGPDSGDFQITGTTNLQTKVWMDSASKAISIIAYSNSTVLATNHFTITVSEATTLPFIVSADVQAGAADGTVIGTAQAAVSEATFSIVGGRSDLFYMDGAELKLTNSADWGSVGTTNYVILQAASGSVSNELVVAAGVGSGATRGMIILVR